MTAVEGVRAKRFPTDAERADMLASVEKMVLARCQKFVRTPSRDSDWGNQDVSDFDHAAQTCRLILWKVAAAFDLDGRSKWSTFAYNAVTHATARCLKAFHKSTRRGESIHLDELRMWDEVADADDGPDDFDPDELDTVERSLSAVHRATLVPALEVLTLSQRRLAEMVAFRRLTLPQVADQLGQKLDIVEKSFRSLLSRLHDAGVVTDEMAAAYGVTIRRPTPKRQWQPGEEDRFLDAVKTNRTQADIAFEFNVIPGRVGATRRNIAAILAAHARAKEPYVKRERLAGWPADEQERFRAALASDRPDYDIAEFRVDPRRVQDGRKSRAALNATAPHRLAEHSAA